MLEFILYTIPLKGSEYITKHYHLQLLGETIFPQYCKAEVYMLLAMTTIFTRGDELFPFWFF